MPTSLSYSFSLLTDIISLSGWAQGLGLRLVGETETSGFLSSLASVYLTKSAVVVAYEGTPYLQADFFRGLYGWLQVLLPLAWLFIFSFAFC